MRLSILVQNGCFYFYLATIINPPSKQILGTYIKRWKGGYSVREFISKKMGSFSESIIFLKMGSFLGVIKWESIWKWGSLGESKMWKIKRGSFSDRRFENGGQCGRTYQSRILREYPPGSPLMLKSLATPLQFCTWIQVIWRLNDCPGGTWITSLMECAARGQKPLPIFKDFFTQKTAD